MLDAAIIGTGPAGLSAAINLKLHDKEFVWFGSENFSDKVAKSEKIANYPGLGLITGAELNQRFAEHIDAMKLDITDKMVTAVMAAKNYYMLSAENELYEARTLLLTLGSASVKGFEGEQELLGRGVSYCATCDGFLYREKTIAVYCGSKRYEHEVMYLADLAAQVYLYTPYGDCEIEAANVSRLTSPIKRVTGDGRVDGIALADGSMVRVDGLFCLRNAVAPAVLLPGLAMDGAHIAVDRHMATNLRGCFAAGDCTGRPYQIAKAVGEGNIAAHSIVEYLSDLDKHKCGA